MKNETRLPKKKSLKALLKEQGTHPVRKYGDVYGTGRELWQSGEEFDRFMTGIRERRHEGVKA